MDVNAMSILLIEDVQEDRDLFAEYAKTRQDVNIVAMTDSSDEGIELVKQYTPEAIILDLELNFGSGTGSGVDFLNELEGLGLNYKPIIVVTTNTPSKIIHAIIRDHGVDFIFYKLQKGYSAEKVINFLFLVRAPAVANKPSQNQEIAHVSSLQRAKEEIPVNIINKELDAIGMDAKYSGRGYIVKALQLTLTNEYSSITLLINDVAANCKKAYTSVMRAIETAIRNTWYDNKEEAEMHYKGRVDRRKNHPTSTDFLQFYTDKLRQK